MYYYKEELINIIKPDPAAAKVLQEILGGHYGEMRTMMQYFFQSSNFRGKEKQFRDLLRGVFLEEIAHVELVQHTINALLDESGAEGPQPRESDFRLIGQCRAGINRRAAKNAHL
ncbi:putative manganese catalase [Bacillus siamensis]|nr:putative manganese catalase [Bacillus siamensis]